MTSPSLNTTEISMAGLCVALLDPGTGRHVPVLTDLDVTLNRGAVLGIAGPSGGGKSTLVTTLAGLLPASARVSVRSLEFQGVPSVAGPSSRWEGEAPAEPRVGKTARREPTPFQGSLVAEGQDISGLAWNELIRRGLGKSRSFAISQDARSALVPGRSVEWHLRRADAARNLGTAASVPPVETLARLGFSPAESYLRRLPSQLSTGECQRIQWGIVCRLRPNVLLADEPFASVSENLANVLAGQLRELAESGSSVMFVTHQLRLLRQLDVPLLVVSGGSMAARGPSSERIGSMGLQTRAAAPRQLPDSGPPGDPTRPFVRVRGLAVRYARSRWSSRETVVFEDRDLTILSGSRTGLTGPSGRGKTTLARVIAGLASATAGTIERLPAEHREWSGPLTTAHRRRWWDHVQLVPQDTDLVFDPSRAVGNSLVQIAQAGDRSLSRTAAWRRAASWSRRFGLGSSALLAPPTRLSGGERRRAAIVQGLLAFGAAQPEEHRQPDSRPRSKNAKARLLILDEPTVGLDRFWQETVANELRGAQSDLNLTLLVISHDRRFVNEFCDRIEEWE